MDWSDTSSNSSFSSNVYVNSVGSYESKDTNRFNEKTQYNDRNTTVNKNQIRHRENYNSLREPISDNNNLQSNKQTNVPNVINRQRKSNFFIVLFMPFLILVSYLLINVYSIYTIHTSENMGELNHLYRQMKRTIPDLHNGHVTLDGDA